MEDFARWITAKLPGGQPYSFKGWESQVYKKIDGLWVIVHLHYSTVPEPTAPPRQ